MSKRMLFCCGLLAALSLPALGAESAPAAEADAVLEADALSLLPALSGGRLLPLDTLARQKLLAFSGKSRHERKPALRWLARVLFTPEAARDDEIFLVNHPEVAEALGLPPEIRRRYTFAELEPLRPKLFQLASAAHRREGASRSPVENELLRLYTGLMEYIRLRESFALFRPHPELPITAPGLKGQLGLPPETTLCRPFDLVAQHGTVTEILSQTRTLARDEWTDDQRELLRLATALNRLMTQHAESLPFIVPAGQAAESRISPWQALNQAPERPELLEPLRALQACAEAYAAGGQEAFDEAAGQALASLSADLQPDQAGRIALEVRFNRAQVFYRSEVFYGLAFLVALLSLAFLAVQGPLGILRRILTWLCVALIVAGLLYHTYGIWARMIIMQRPPVTNLYSTFVFVAWCCALLGLVVEALQRNRLGLLAAASSGLALLLTAGRFAVDGDTMGVMVAVLDSNFWLATHVVTITMGYAGCCMAGLVGHIYLVMALFLPAKDSRLVEISRTLYGTLAFGLIFSFLGTMLGGIWADQSWGRFWGWDPKENGALVIVLWSAILFHARLARMIGPRGFAAGSVVGIVWVLLAWMGVNLLGVGLHSYGFTSSLARGLVLICAVEALFLVVVGLLGLRFRPPARA